MKLIAVPSRKSYDSFSKYEIDNWHSLINNRLFRFQKVNKIVYEKKKIMEKVKIIRTMYLFLKRNQYKIFTFKHIKYWRTVAKKKCEMEQNLLDKLETKEEFSSQYNKYIILTLKTLRSYDSNYANKILMSLFRKFPHDVAREIKAFI